MIQFLAVIALATLFTKGAIVLWGWSGWLVIPYVGFGFVAGWFLQTEDEQQATLEWWHRWL